MNGPLFVPLYIVNLVAKN